MIVWLVQGWSNNGPEWDRDPTSLAIFSSLEIMREKIIGDWQQATQPAIANPNWIMTRAEQFYREDKTKGPLMITTQYVALPYELDQWTGPAL